MNRVLLMPFSIAVVLHVALAIVAEPRVEIDSAFYRTQAEALVTQGASLDAAGQPETRYTWAIRCSSCFLPADSATPVPSWRST